MARTQEQRRAETRGRLLDAAADLFAHKGFHAVSAEAVADAAGRTTGALYDHFGGKDGLLLALQEVWKEQTVASLLDAIGTSMPVDGRLRALWASLSQPAGDRGDAWLLLEIELWLHGARSPEIGVALAERYADARRRLGEGLAEWAAEVGVHLPRTPNETAVLVLGLLVGGAIQHRLDPAAVPDAVVMSELRALVGLSTNDQNGSTEDHKENR